MRRDILVYPDPFLARKAAPVTAVDDRVRALIRDMFETMYGAEGVGLAAPQVGVGKRVIVVDEDYRATGLITMKDIEKAQAHPHAAKDDQGRLLVGAASSVTQHGSKSEASSNSESRIFIGGSLVFVARGVPCPRSPWTCSEPSA